MHGQTHVSRSNTTLTTATPNHNRLDRHTHRTHRHHSTTRATTLHTPKTPQTPQTPQTRQLKKKMPGKPCGVRLVSALKMRLSTVHMQLHVGTTMACAGWRLARWRYACLPASFQIASCLVGLKPVASNRDWSLRSCSQTLILATWINGQ